MARQLDEDDLFDFQDDRFLSRLEELFADNDLTNAQRPRKVATAPNQRGVAISLTSPMPQMTDDAA